MRDAALKREEILQLIPQRPPMVMVDKFHGVNGDFSYSGLTIQPENIFCQTGYFAEVGLIEHIAQSAAARVGYIYTQKGESVPLGFIGSVDKFKLHKLPQVGNELYTEIQVMQEIGDITLISAKTRVAEELVAECKMKIFLKKD
ncbi:MAG: hydroxymyristoyl-ACP dehydratase [Prevotellaceae bacterium]|nr:hydroxymyristoyl-ACP dehydratase [Prevotellaceae bacterium]